MNTTVRMKASQITKEWHVVDAANRPLGRVATEVATLLRGKHKPTYEPHLDDGDFVIVINASQVRVSGNKAQQIKYRRHSGYPGGLRERSFTEQLNRHPDRIIEQAVWGMLPSGPLAEAMFKHLKVYAGPSHPHQSQIIGSERARAAREEAAANAGPAPLKQKRLRPLPTTVSPELVEEPAAPEPEPEPVPSPRRRVRRSKSDAPETPAAEAPNAEAPASDATASAEAAPSQPEAPAASESEE